MRMMKETKRNREKGRERERRREVNISIRIQERRHLPFSNSIRASTKRERDVWWKRTQFTQSFIKQREEKSGYFGKNLLELVEKGGKSRGKGENRKERERYRSFQCLFDWSDNTIEYKKKKKKKKQREPVFFRSTNNAGRTSRDSFFARIAFDRPTTRSPSSDFADRWVEISSVFFPNEKRKRAWLMFAHAHDYVC